MPLFEFALALLSLTFLFHLVVWRVRLPRRQTRALVVIFFTALPLGIVVANVVPALRCLGLSGFWPCLHVAVFHVAASLAYIVAYSALENRSPTMAIMTFVADGPEQGRSREEVAGLLKDDSPVEQRLRTAVHERMLEEGAGDYRLTPKGRAWALVFSAWSQVSKMKKGG